MLTDLELRRLMDHYLGGPSYARPSQHYLGLHVGDQFPDFASGDGFVEPGDSEYARFLVANVATFWIASAVPNSGPNAGQVVKHNQESVTFPRPSVAWGSPTHVGIFADEAGGVPQAILTMPPGLDVIGAGEIVRFSPGRLTLVARR